LSSVLNCQLSTVNCQLNEKVRAKNSDAQVGKIGGYRLIYQVESPNQVVLHLIYSKSEQANVSAEEIQTAIVQYQADPDD